jgi:hypothetical protein
MARTASIVAAEPMRADSPSNHPLIVIEAESLAAAQQMGLEVVSGGETLESMAKAMQDHSARLGLDRRGAFWFAEPTPTSDALLSIARLLQWLSSTDMPLSRLWMM